MMEETNSSNSFDQFFLEYWTISNYDIKIF